MTQLNRNLILLHFFLTLMIEVKFGMNHWYTWIFEVCRNWKLKTWLLVYLKCPPQKESIRDVCLGSIIRHHSTLEKHGEQKTYWSWFTMMFAPSIYLHWKVQGIFWISFMICLALHGSIFWRTRTLYLKSSRTFEPLLKNNMADPSSAWDHTMVVSM